MVRSTMARKCEAWIAAWAKNPIVPLDDDARQQELH